jgi:hypothetical protein
MLAATPSFPHLKRTKGTCGFAENWCVWRWGCVQQATDHVRQDNKSAAAFEQLAQMGLMVFQSHGPHVADSSTWNVRCSSGFQPIAHARRCCIAGLTIGIDGFGCG